MVSPLRALALTALLASACGACSSDVNPLRDAAIQAGYGAKPIKAPDFVEKSRGTDPEFMPVGVSAPKRPVRAKTAEDQKALQAELEGARSRNEARGRSAEGAGKAAKPAAAPPPPE